MSFYCYFCRLQSDQWLSGRIFHSACSITRRCRTSGVSPCSTSTAFCKMIGPVSVPSSTKCTVAPSHFHATFQCLFMHLQSIEPDSAESRDQGWMDVDDTVLCISAIISAGITHKKSGQYDQIRHQMHLQPSKIASLKASPVFIILWGNALMPECRVSSHAPVHRHLLLLLITPAIFCVRDLAGIYRIYDCLQIRSTTGYTATTTLLSIRSLPFLRLRSDRSHMEYHLSALIAAIVLSTSAGSTATNHTDTHIISIVHHLLCQSLPSFASMSKIGGIG